MKLADLIKTTLIISGILILINIYNKLILSYSYFHLYDMTLNDDAKGTFYIGMMESVASIVITIPIGLVLIFKNDWIVKKILKQEGSSVILNITKHEFLHVGLILLGIYGLIRYVPELLRQLLFYTDIEHFSEINFNHIKVILFYGVIVGLLVMMVKYSYSCSEYLIRKK